MNSPVKLWRNQEKIRNLNGKTGTVISFTVIYVPPAGFEDQAPYGVALVDIDGKKTIGQITDCEITDIKIGMKVRATIRRVRNPDAEGVIAYGIKFVTRL